MRNKFYDASFASGERKVEIPLWNIRYYVDIKSNLNKRIILKNENHFYFDILDNCCICKKIKQSLKQPFEKPFDE